ncbi:MAG: hypothetical protein JRI47_01525 [Deltaproteobacteria bacterium]|nr:hypothetical protein [Deltaproteobacteria bacterium]
MKPPSDKKDPLALITTEELVRLPANKALEAIIDAPRPVSLVQSLAEEDLYWLINDIGIQDALPVLSLASNDQWQYLLDLELWTKDRLDTEATSHWLGLLMKADPERFMIWSLREHLELIELFLIGHVDVKIREHDQSPSDFADEYFTLDDTFYIRIGEKNYEKTTQEFLQRLADYDNEKYQQVLLELAALIPAETEEQIYRLRNVRLAEKGFLPFEEAVGIYQYRNPESLRQQEHESQSAARAHPADETAPLTTSILLREHDLFYKALQQIDDDAFLERLEREFAAMCNQIICADSRSVRDKEALLATVAKACGYLSIGIDRVVDKNPQEAFRLVQDFPLQEIFRVGFGASLELRLKAEKWLKESWFLRQGLDFNFWDEEWAGILEGLLKKHPLLYASLSEGEPYREFKTLEEVVQCQQALDEMMAVDDLLSQVFFQGDVANTDTVFSPVTFKSLLLTCWARHQLGLLDNLQPISEKELKAFLAGPFVGKEAKQAFWDWLENRCGMASKDLAQRVGRPVDHLLGELEEEYGTVSPKDLDVRYVRLFQVTP